jgi:hypothetical protein
MVWVVCGAVAAAQEMAHKVVAHTKALTLAVREQRQQQEGWVQVIVSPSTPPAPHN